MIYRTKLFFLRSAVWLAGKAPGITQRVSVKQTYSPDRVAPILDNELRAAHIREYVPGKSFLDAGCMFRSNGAYVFYAEKCGAARSTGMDIVPESDAFKEHKALQRSSAEFVRGDINDEKIIKEIGKTDVVLCNGVLYHTPDPFLLLTRLREMCRETLLLYTSTIPEMPGLRNVAVFYPYLGSRQRKIWAPPRRGKRPGLGRPYDPERGYGNWFWGVSPSCAAALLQCAGFRVDKVVRHRPFAHLFVCSANPARARF